MNGQDCANMCKLFTYMTPGFEDVQQETRNYHFDQLAVQMHVI